MPIPLVHELFCRTSRHDLRTFEGGIASMIRVTGYFLSFCGFGLLVVGCAAPPTPPTPPTPDLAGALQSLANADSALVSINAPAPCCDRQNLPQFLGVECVAKGVAGLVNRLRNRLGMAFPGLEAKPPVLAITDPANMSEDAPPAVKAAAGIKAEEDAAAQKIKAIRYLATIGCGGCYPDVEDALIAAMEDCTEEVRYEAVKAVRSTTCTSCCYCSCQACCTEKVQNKLRELAYDQPAPCCGGEPSARVRRQARLALAACGPPVIYEEPDAPDEEPIEAPVEGPDGPPPPPPTEEEELPPADGVVEASDASQPTDDAASPTKRTADAGPRLRPLPPIATR